MGIKNIHIILIAASVLVCLFFGLWSVNNTHVWWGGTAFVVAAALAVYGINFIKRSKTL